VRRPSKSSQAGHGQNDGNGSHCRPGLCMMLRSVLAGPVRKINSGDTKHMPRSGQLRVCQSGVEDPVALLGTYGIDVWDTSRTVDRR
jgi:hypothetical protein